MISKSYQQLLRIGLLLCLFWPLATFGAVIESAWQEGVNQGQLVLEPDSAEPEPVIGIAKEPINPLDLLNEQGGASPAALADKSITPPLFGQGGQYTSSWVADFLNLQGDNSGERNSLLVLIKILGVFIAVGLLLLVRRLWVLRKLKARYMERVIID